MLISLVGASFASAEDLTSSANTPTPPKNEWMNFRLSADDLSGGNGGSYLTPEIDWTPAFISTNGYRFLPRLGALALKTLDGESHQGFVVGGHFEGDITEHFFAEGGLGVVKYSGYSGATSISAGLGGRISKTSLLREIFFDLENYDIGQDPTFILKFGITIGFF